MNKEKFLISTIILVFGGFITKILGMVIKIITTRVIGVDGISLYTLIFPTFSLFMTVSQLGFPIAISKLVAEDKYNNKNIIFSIVPFSLIINILLMLIIFIIAPFLTNNLLRDYRCYYPILAIAFVLPFDSLSSIFRGYFFGKQRMIPHVTSNIVEQIVRLILIVIIVPFLLESSVVYAVVGLVLVNVVSELVSALTLIFFMPKVIDITRDDTKIKKDNIKNVIDIAVPTTGGRIASSIGFFFEPIILTYALMFAGYEGGFFIREYGIIEAYVIPLLMLPSFFNMAISSALIPAVSKASSLGNKAYIKRKLKQAVLISLGIGIVITTILMLFPNFFLETIYNSKHGSTYLRFIAPFFLIYYFQNPLASVLQAIGKSKSMMYDNFIGIGLRSILMFFLSLLRIGMFGFIISMIINIIIVTILHIIHIKKELFS